MVLNNKFIESPAELNMPIDHKTNMLISHSLKAIAIAINKASLLNPITLLECVSIRLRIVALNEDPAETRQEYIFKYIVRLKRWKSIQVSLICW